MQEVDILKYLLLSDEQAHLVGFLSRPSVSLRDDKSPLYKTFEEEQKKIIALDRDEIEKIYHSYHTISSSQDFMNSKENKKLIGLFNSEIECLEEQ